MTSREFRERLNRRARRIDLAIPAETASGLERYFGLLARWNAKINLTALPLSSPTDETFDRLLIEPLAAGRHLADIHGVWIDLGSGGGSPAIPLKIARPDLALIMVESKVRKAAFLREAIRALSLADARVENIRFEELLARAEFHHKAALVTVRAVRADEALFRTASALLRADGRIAMFRPNDSRVSAPGFRFSQTFALMENPASYLTTMARVFHVEQTG